MRERLVFLESSDIGARYSGLAALALGYEPLFICDLRHYQADPRNQLSEFDVIDSPTGKATEVLAALKGIPRIAAITSLADTRMRVSREVATTLEVAGIDPIVHDLKDKSAVQQLVPEFSPQSVDFSFAEIPFAELEKIFRTGPGLIVKPVDSAGALGLIHIQSAEEISRLATHPVLPTLPEELRKGRWIAQSFVSGDLISVEGFVHDRRARILGVSRRKKVGATESASTFPADNSLHPAARQRAIDTVLTLVQRSGYSRGYFHIEFIVNESQCTLIDANIGRVGGGSVGQQLALAYGHDPVDVYQHVFATSLFPDRLKSESQMYLKPISSLSETFAILYGLENGGRLHEVRLPQRMSTFHTQVLGQGAQVSPMGRDDWSWIGIICGRTAETLRTVREIDIVTDDGVFKPFY